jgi:hypothetical protein
MEETLRLTYTIISPGEEISCNDESAATDFIHEYIQDLTVIKKAYFSIPDKLMFYELDDQYEYQTLLNTKKCILTLIVHDH